MSSNLKHLTSISIAVSLLGVCQANAADKPGYLPPMAPSVDASINKAPAVASDDDSNGDQVKSLLRQALEKHNQGDIRGAESLFGQVLKIDPNNVDANFNLGTLSEDRKDWPSALRYYTAASRANPGDRDIRDAISEVKQQMQQQQGEVQTEAALEKKNRLRELGEDAAKAYRDGKFKDAIMDLQEIEREDPSDANTLFALGQAYKGDGDAARARQYIQRAAQLEPNNKTFAAALADTAAPTKKTASADEMPPAAPDYHSRRPPPVRSGWVEENEQPPPANGYRDEVQDYREANGLEDRPSGPDAQGVTPFTQQGEGQLQRRAVNSGGDGYGTIYPGMGTGMGIGGIGMGLGSLMGIMRGAVLGSPVPYGGYGYGGYGMPYGGLPMSPYGMRPMPYGTYGVGGMPGFGSLGTFRIGRRSTRGFGF